MNIDIELISDGNHMEEPAVCRPMAPLSTELLNLLFLTYLAKFGSGSK